MKPFEPGSLHPSRRALFGTGDEIECCADAKDERRSDLGRVPRHPKLLLRRTKAAPDDIWRRRADRVDRGAEVDRVEWSVRGREAAGDLRFGKHLEQALANAGENSRR